MNDLNLQGFNSDEAFQELNAEELTSVDGGSDFVFFIPPGVTMSPEGLSLRLDPSDHGVTFGGPVEPVQRVFSRGYRGPHRIQFVVNDPYNFGR